MPFWIDKYDVFQRLYVEGFFSVAFRVDVKENLLKRSLVFSAKST